MRLRAWLAGGAVLGAAAWACDAITLPTEVRAPVNECTDPSTCAAVFPEAGLPPSCASSTCVTAASFPHVLVVATPTVAPVAPGIAFGLPSTPLTATPTCTALPSPDLTCVWLPQLVTNTGEILVSDGFGAQLLPPGGLRPNVPRKLGSPTETTLPLVATFHPMWLDPATGEHALAAHLGLPLGPISAVSGPLNPFAAPAPTNGTADVLPGQSFAVSVPGGFSLGDTLGTYLVQMTPTDPYSMFPPLVTEVSVPVVLNNVEYTLPGQGQFIGSTQYTTQTNPGAPSLAGWTAYAVDQHGFRITGKVALTGAPDEPFTLYDATGTTDQTGQTLYVVPPDGVSLPIYVDKALGPILGRQISYPALPPPVTVQAHVQVPADPARIIAARVVFVADGGPDGAAVETNDPITPFSQQLYYRAETVTDASGNCQVTLPPGNYRAYVIPTDPDLALSVLPIAVAKSPAVQPGKGLDISPRLHLRGAAVLGDGTPLFGAQVVVDPSADAPLDAGFDALALPRESTGSLDVSGQFDVLVDPGTVDISVRPQDGTRYPWVVSTNWKVLTDTTLPKPFVVPPPEDPSTSRSGGQLADAVGNPLTRTVVRAYAFPPAPSAGDGGTKASRGARLVGMTITDDQGLFALYLTAPDP